MSLGEAFIKNRVRETVASNCVALTDLDRRFMDAALRLGQSQIGRTAPNPSVGAILVAHREHGSVVIGRGVTGLGGRPHGEVMALEEAGNEARGATCYVGLEPCAHHGKTPPCVEALIRAGVGRVVVGVCDPDPRVSGKGLQDLRQANISVVEYEKSKAAMDANVGHFQRILTRRPAITLKLAVSSDGMIGRKGDGQVKITGADARRHAHALRARSDAILIGSGTLIADDPKLTCRLPGMEHWSPMPVVLSSDARLPENAALFHADTGQRSLFYVGPSADPEKVETLSNFDAYVEKVSQEEGLLNLDEVMANLALRGVTNLLVEGGAKLATSLLEKKLVHRAMIYTSKVTIGEGGIPALTERHELQEVLSQAGLSLEHRQPLGDDRLEIWRAS